MTFRLFARRPALTYDMLNQRQLTLLKFRKHKLAVAAGFLLAGLYVMAIFSPFFAPYGKYERNLDYIYCPPQKLGFNWEKGLYARGLKRAVDPVTLNSRYVDAPENDAPLGFFVKGKPYRLWGIIPSERHFFGVDPERIPDFRPGDEARYVYFLAGADKFGCDIWSRIVQGSTISLSVGLVGVFLSFLFGVVIGGISGYCGGAVDTAIQRVIEIINSFPQLPMWLALAAAVPSDWGPLETYFAITVTLSLLSWTGLARVVRGKILSLREEDYAVAARLLGASHPRILFRHLLPAFASHIIVTLTLTVPGMILGETSLSFLGLGLRPPVVSWGVMLQDCMNVKAVIDYPWLLAPVLMLVFAVLCFNFLGDGLRDAADPYASK
ncbi:ABC transporter permease [uncultured Victivallis sp.]|uniref:ABC transporter permease n=1 Tax=uncultured Victivallis sp. TaxID=354118 RepID=UPI0025E8CC79|nr:ABC transporter permease [uncultured Victivallis sp.]